MEESADNCLPNERDKVDDSMLGCSLETGDAAVVLDGRDASSYDGRPRRLEMGVMPLRNPRDAIP